MYKLKISEGVRIWNQLSNKGILDMLAALKHRWQDEKYYEDFEEYRKKIKKDLSEYAKVINITRNFEITLDLGDNYILWIKVNMREIKYKIKRNK